MMATSRSKQAICSFVEDGTLELEVEAGSTPFYSDLVVTADVLIVIESKRIQIHRRRDGKLLFVSDRLESNPWCMCLISNRKVAVILQDSLMEIMSFGSTELIERVTEFRVRTRFYPFHSVVKVKSMDKLVVSGYNTSNNMLCWCLVNLADESVESTHIVCEGYSRSYLAVQNDTVYILCPAYNSLHIGVYSYHIPNPTRPTFFYNHQDLHSPSGLFVDTRHYIYAFNNNPHSIHQLTERGELVTIHTLSSCPFEIFYEEQDGVLYSIDKHGSNKITRYRQQDSLCLIARLRCIII